MNEFIKSWFDNIHLRTTTPLYGVFTTAFITFHWQFFYTWLFENENLIYKKYGLLKDEYLHHLLFNASSRVSTLASLVLWLMPFLLTYLIIWQFPKYISIPAYRREQEDKASREKIRIGIEKEIEKERRELESETINTLEETEKKLNKEMDLEKKSVPIWNDDYEEFKNTNFFHSFHQLIDSLYEYSGRISFTDPDGYEFELNKELLAYCDSSGLVNFDQDQKIISLTDKGRYFVSTYSRDRHTTQKK